MMTRSFRPTALLGGYIVAACCGLPALLAAQGPPEPGTELRPPADRAGIDVLQYDLRIDLRDIAEARLAAHAGLRVALDAGMTELRLDFAGLTVDSVFFEGERAGFQRDGAVLRIETPHFGHPVEADIDIHYHGAPRDGLFFGPDPTGRATAFADNWPNRARWWFPSNDHPSDKATVRYDVRVPEGFEVVANGRLLIEPASEVTPGGADAGADAPPGQAPRGEAGRDGVVWSWETTVPIPTYTMVIGVADFGDAVLGEAACGRTPATPDDCVDISTWALEGDSAYAVDRFTRAPDMVDYYAGLIAPFPYEKLAHVESSTRFGGMENSSAIFYAMAPWNGRSMGEGVIAHETAHQWFGDAVTPADWRHLWVSEGFATYFAALYVQDRDGEDAFRRILEEDRLEILRSDASAHPIVKDTTALFWLLNENNYEKGSWVLHMLRGLLGDSTFFAALRAYYDRYEHTAAETGDLRRVLEEVSGERLGWFFEQWVHRPGYPVLGVDWRTSADDDGEAATLALEIAQLQADDWPTYRLPMEVAVRLEDGRELRLPVVIDARRQTVRLRVPGPVESVELDPDGWVLKAIR